MIVFRKNHVKIKLRYKCYISKEKQSRNRCVKCWLNRELSAGRKAERLRYRIRIPLLHCNDDAERHLLML